jgi:hypothetical protein
MSWMLAYAPCLRCGEFFGFNPRCVPTSSVLTGRPEPLCRGCVDGINAIREALGLERQAIPVDAYEPAEVQLDDAAG